MTSAESRALERAALLVLTLCVVRAVASYRSPAGAVPQEVADSEAATLLRESGEMRSEGARRTRPLSADEKIDPNTATEEALDRLPGVGPATARRIVSHREVVGTFSEANDLLAVPGIGAGTLARIEPFLVWSDPSRGGARPVAGRPGRAGDGRSQRPPVIDLNRATQKELEKLPGVGPALARRILALRDSLGGFRTADDLERVWGLGPITVARLKPLVLVGR